MLLRKLIFLQLLLFVTFFSVGIAAMNDYDRNELRAYTLIAETNVVSDFEGSDFDKLVELDNGMIFRFQSYSYHYAYRPLAYVYEYYAPLNEVRRVVPNATNDITIYKLIIDDDVYSVTRVK